MSHQMSHPTASLADLQDEVLNIEKTSPALRSWVYRTDFTPSQKLCLLTLIDHRDYPRETTISLRLLQEITGISYSSVSNILNELAGKGHIEISRTWGSKLTTGSGRNINTYILPNLENSNHIAI